MSECHKNTIVQFVKGKQADFTKRLNKSSTLIHSFKVKLHMDS